MMNDTLFLAYFDLWSMIISALVALAVVAAIGYLFGRKNKKVVVSCDAGNARRELRRAREVAKEMEKTAQHLRCDLARHHTSILKFRERLSDLGKRTDATWKDLCREAEIVLGPTARLVSQISEAYDSIRRQTVQLKGFTEGRTDSSTGVSNRLALHEALDSMLALHARYRFQVSVALIAAGRTDTGGGDAENGEATIKQVAKLVDENVDLILLDIMMPGMPPIDLLKNISEHGLSNVKCIYVTAVPFPEEDNAELISGGQVVDFIEKPFDNADLVARVKAAFGAESQTVSVTLRQTFRDTIV